MIPGEKCYPFVIILYVTYLFIAITSRLSASESDSENSNGVIILIVMLQFIP